MNGYKDSRWAFEGEHKSQALFFFVQLNIELGEEGGKLLIFHHAVCQLYSYSIGCYWEVYDKFVAVNCNISTGLVVISTDYFLSTAGAAGFVVLFFANVGIFHFSISIVVICGFSSPR